MLCTCNYLFCVVLLEPTVNADHQYIGNRAIYAGLQEQQNRASCLHAGKCNATLTSNHSTKCRPLAACADASSRVPVCMHLSKEVATAQHQEHILQAFCTMISMSSACHLHHDKHVCTVGCSTKLTQQLQADIEQEMKSIHAGIA